MHMDRHTRRMFATLNLGYTNLLKCCERLAGLGDIAKGHPYADECRETRDHLVSCLGCVHVLEEMSLLPALERKAIGDPVMGYILRRLQAEHTDDALYLEEVVWTLDSLALGQQPPSDYARSVFLNYVRGIRRHVALERHTVRRIIGRGAALQLH